MSELIRLNVGGELYVTTRSTLTRYPDSMIGAMFSNGLPTTKDENGHYFVDRDGKIFRHILTFLRSSRLSISAEDSEFEMLCIEADFYQIQPLIDLLKSLSEQQKPDPDTKNGHLLEITEVRTGSTATMPTRNSRIKTILIGSKYVLRRLPDGILPESQLEKLFAVKEDDCVEVELTKSPMRVKLSEFLHNSGCQQVSTWMSSSSGHGQDNTELCQSLLITEHSYREVWFLSRAITKKWKAVEELFDRSQGFFMGYLEDYGEGQLLHGDEVLEMYGDMNHG